MRNISILNNAFVSERGLHCIVHVRGVFVCKGKQVPLDVLVKEAGYTDAAPELPPEVVKWESVLQLKKERNM